MDKKSATLGLSGMREEQLGLEANYETICKFDSASSDIYEHVADNIADFARRAMEFPRGSVVKYM